MAFTAAARLRHLRLRKALEDQIAGKAVLTLAAAAVEAPVAVGALRRSTIEPEVVVGQLVLEQHPQPGEDRADVQDLMTVVGLMGERGDRVLVEIPILVGQVIGQWEWALRLDVLGQGSGRDRLELEAEGIDLAREGRMLAIEVERRADQEKKILHRHQVAHLLARDLQQLILQCAQLRRASVAGDGPDRVGGEQVLHHQRVLDLRRGIEQEGRFVAGDKARLVRRQIAPDHMLSRGGEHGGSRLRGMEQISHDMQMASHRLPPPHGCGHRGREMIRLAALPSIVTRRM
jgi:hypothetical protein